MSCVDSVRIAFDKVWEYGHDVCGAVLVSDAFFLFADGPQAALEAGVIASSPRARDYPTVLELVGNTPIVRLDSVGRDVEPEILAKLEYLNPGGSVKDRIGLAMIEKAEAEGKLKPGGTIVEPTSGNTGVGRAIPAAKNA